MTAQRRNALLLSALLLAAPLALSGCGFTPVYAQKDLGVKLSNIAVVTSDTRTGFLLRQKLVTAFNTSDASVKPFRLDVVLKETRYDVGRQVDDTATRSEISNAVTYSLTDTETKRVLTKGTFIDTTTYDATTQSPYAGIVAQKDGQERAASSISERIQADLTLWFYNQPKPAQ